MKKFLIIILSAIVGTTGLIKVMQPNGKQFALNSLSEIRYNIFGGNTDAFGATLMTGERETPYILDGVPQELIEFGIITLHFKIPTSSFNGNPSFRLTIDDTYYDGEFERNPFDNTYVADIKTKTYDDSNVYLLVEWDNLYETTKLEPRSITWELDWEAALEKALDNTDIINKLIVDGVLQAEVHVQIIGDPQGVSDKYFWYVSIYGRNGSVVTVVIDPLTGQIVTKRVVEY